MRLFSVRRLTAGEIALGRGVFADEIAWRAVRIAQAPKAGFAAMVPLGRTIVYSGWRAPADFNDASLDEQGWFVHELAHVWQAQRGVVLAAAKLAALGTRAYRYDAVAGARWGDFNIESQAEIARHLFLARRGAGVRGMAGRAWLENVWEGRSKPSA
jgi:hypothetical protein